MATLDPTPNPITLTEQYRTVEAMGHMRTYADTGLPATAFWIVHARCTTHGGVSAIVEASTKPDTASVMCEPCSEESGYHRSVPVTHIERDLRVPLGGLSDAERAALECWRRS